MNRALNITRWPVIFWIAVAIAAAFFGGCDQNASERESVDQLIEAENDYYEKHQRYTENIATLLINYPHLNDDMVEMAKIFVEDDGQGVYVKHQTYAASAVKGMVKSRTCDLEPDQSEGHCQDGQWGSEEQ